MVRRVDRRIFLRGLGGACVAAPFLGTLAGRRVKAGEPAAPKRLFLMFTHNGCITTRFFPRNSNGRLTAADLEETSLKALAPYVDKVLIPRGIRAMNEWTADLSRGQGNDPHTQVCGTYFTCQPVTPNSDEPFSFDTASKFNAKPVGPSLDHVIAQQVCADGTPLLMRVGKQNDSPMSAVSYSAATTAYPGLGTPAQVFSLLTGLFAGGSLSPDSYQVARGKSVLDVVKDDLESLERFDMSQADRQKLEAWKQLVSETTQPPVMGPLCTTDFAASLGVTQAVVDANSASDLGTDFMATTLAGTSFDGADLFSNLAAMAAVCNMSSVMLLKYPQSYVFKSLGITTDSASLAHRIGNAGLSGQCMSGAIDMLLTVDEFYARKFAYLVDVLSRIPEGEGNVLDNAAVVWCQEQSDGLAENLNNIPIVQAGSLGGAFKTGAAVNVWDGSPDLSRGNSEYYCVDGASDMVDGISQNSGTDPALANAPINKYFCNLMNAMGVKAGPDGFPLQGGQEQVTHYGMYDRTEDFIGGGSNPPQITDPGEFTQLRA
ncbi:MAG TPA: DUF1552 domain-containing protein [Polyangiaceae bacterium]|jgi:hypothetical protein|nr:DUF1552 domain-containing protein [Polyangiaceae bacterium]